MAFIYPGSTLYHHHWSQSMVKKHPENLACWTQEKKVSKGKGQKHAMPTISSILWWLEARRPQVCCRLGLSRCLAVCMARLASDKLLEDHSGLACRQHQDPHVEDLAVTQFSDMLNLLKQIIRWDDDESWSWVLQPFVFGVVTLASWCDLELNLPRFLGWT